MIKSITVTNPNDESLKIDLFRPEDTGLVVYSIDGLGPATADINMSELTGMDGSVYNSSKIQNRNIVITFGFLWKPTVESARLLTYKYFPIKKRIKIDIETENRRCYAIGYVESNTPDIFSSEETTQISIICPDPYFYESGSGREVVVSGIQPLFEFPFHNEIVTGEEKTIEFGERMDVQIIPIDYIGDMDTGMQFDIRVEGTYTGEPLVSGNIVLYKSETGEVFAIDIQKLNSVIASLYPTAPASEKMLINGDDVIISTIRGEKHAWLLRRGEYTNIINAIDINSQWFELTAGRNSVGYYVQGESNPNLKLAIRYKNAYGGV